MILIKVICKRGVAFTHLIFMVLLFYFFLKITLMECDWYISSHKTQRFTTKYISSHAKCKFLIIAERLFPVSTTEHCTKGHKTCL